MRSPTVNKISTSKNWKLSLTSCSFAILFGCSVTQEQPKVSAIALESNNTTETEVLSSNQIILPQISNKIDHPTNFSDCGLNFQSRELAKLIIQDSEQQRVVIRCDKRLAKIARSKAQEMAELGVVSHKSAIGSPNQRLIVAQYPLTKSEWLQFNTVEAVMGGEEHPEEVWLSFQSSFPHKVHLLGEDKFYLNQTQLGVGHFRKLQSPHLDYWAVYFVNINE